MRDYDVIKVLALTQIRWENSGEGVAECNFFLLRKAQDSVGEIVASHGALEHEHLCPASHSSEKGKVSDVRPPHLAPLVPLPCSAALCGGPP